MLAVISLACGTPVFAQGPATGTVRGRVVRTDFNLPVRNAVVSIEGTTVTTTTDSDGRYVLSLAPAGSRVLAVRAIGFRSRTIPIAVSPGSVLQQDVSLESAPLMLSEVVVTGASRVPQLTLDAPAAVGVVSERLQRDYGPTDQVPQTLVRLPGVDAVQTGVNQWDVNARGFNTTNTRRVVVLLDGRDLGLAFLGSQEWSALSIPLEDLASLEFVRGPGSALYGPNAFSGVLMLTTPSARDIVGTRLSVAGGELGTFQGGIRNAGVFGSGRFGYRVHAGYVTSDTWSRSRTNTGDFSREYADAIDTVRHPVASPAPGFEIVPLAGQHKQGAPFTPGAAIGDRDPVTRLFGGIRLDYYATGGELTLEAGDSRSENETSVTGVGRVQTGNATRPWARLGWRGDRLSAFAYYSGRRSSDQIALASGANLRETSATYHGEVQYHRPVLAGRGRVVAGGSVRALMVDSDETLLAAETDDRTDEFYSGFGQLEYDVTRRVRVIGAIRVDGGNLFDTEFSPKGAVVWTPNERNAIRATVNRAFKTPVILEYFLSVPAGAPADFSALEDGFRASPLGPALSGVPQGQLFTQSSAVPVLALGNEQLDVEHVTSWELGYKGQLSSGVYVTADVYYSRLTGFVTELLPGVNPLYAPWTAPDEVPADVRPVVAGAVRDALAGAGQALAAAALTRLPDGRTAIVVSVGNAGRASDYGLELGLTARLRGGLELDANYTLFGFEVDATSLVPGQQVLPNTPKHKANLSLAWRHTGGFDARLTSRYVAAFDWAGGVFVGRVPSLTTIDLLAGHQLTPLVRAQLAATNLLDQRRYQVFGGSLIGRRALLGLSARLP
jgi:iron complex outermembrane receptor protein